MDLPRFKQVRARLWQLSVIVVVVCALGLAGCREEPLKEQLLTLDQVAQLLAEGRTESASDAVKSILREQPSNARARLLLGQVYLAEGDGTAAEFHLRRSKEQGFTAPELFISLLRALLIQGKYSAVLQESGEDFRFSNEVYTLHGWAHYWLKDAESARNSFQTALVNQPDAQEPLPGLVALALDSGRLSEAETLLRRFKLADAEFWLLSGRLALLQHRLDAAEAAYQRVTHLRREDVRGALGLIKVALVSGRADSALQNINLLLADNPNNLGALYLRALAALQANTPALAEASILEVLDRSPEHVASLKILGAAHLAQGSLEQAAEVFTRCLNIVPGDLAVRKIVALARLWSASPYRTLDLIGPALAEQKVDRQLLSMAFIAQMITGDARGAVERLHILEAASPDEPENSSLKALSAYALSESAEVERMLMEALEVQRANQLERERVLQRVDPKAGQLASGAELDSFAVVSHPNAIEREDAPSGRNVADAAAGSFAAERTLKNMVESLAAAIIYQIFPQIDKNLPAFLEIAEDLLQVRSPAEVRSWLVDPKNMVQADGHRTGTASWNGQPHDGGGGSLLATLLGVYAFIQQIYRFGLEHPILLLPLLFILIGGTIAANIYRFKR
ncbi:MAG: tetratricopeptide repeat protein [Chromatiaceae bacterium]|nr:tetratricopeptide repeat protein [Chromatiaceae bacterium]